MNKLKASTIALIAIGAAIIGLGAAVVLTMPKDAWSSVAAFHGGRFAATGADGGRAGENSAEAAKDSGAAGSPPCLPYRGAMGGYSRGSRPFGRPMNGGGHGHGPGGLVLLALLVGAGIGCAAYRKNGLIAKEDK